MKLKTLRKAREQIINCIRGWTGKITTRKYNLIIDDKWKCISRLDTPIIKRSKLDSENRNRIHNMKLSAAMIDKTILMPGEIFSMQNSVGEATTKRGFKKGPILIRGTLQYTIGGGLCQISSTLFSAVLAANMKILQKRNHSRDIWGEKRFVALGRDATYAYLLIDLKFQNKFMFPVILRCYVDETRRKVIVKILSQSHLLYEVIITTKKLKILYPKRNSNNDKTANGWIVRTIRRISNNTINKITYNKREKYKPGINKNER